MRSLFASLLASGLAAISGSIEAQGSRPPAFEDSYTVKLAKDQPLSKLVAAFDRGEWPDVESFLNSFKRSFNSTEAVPESSKLDSTKNYYSILFLDNTDAADSKKAVSELALGRVLYHDPPSPDPFPLTILDRSRFIEILILPEARKIEAQTDYSVTRMENPLIKSAGRFFQKFIGAAVTGVTGAPRKDLTPGQPEEVVRVSVRTIQLPWDRCTVEIHDQPSEAAFLEAPKAPAKGAHKITTTYTVEPSAKATFGLLTSGVVASSLNPRVKTDNGVLTADPIKSPLSAAILNWQPWGYDPTLFSPSASEKWRLFGGAAFSPEFGLVAGGGYSPIRGVSFDVGYAALLVNTLRSGDSIGKKPRDAAHPTRRGVTGALFVGLGFSLE